MNLSKVFSRREKALLIVLAVLLLIAVYLYAVHFPVTAGMEQARMEKDTLTMELTVLEARQTRMEQMQAELERVWGDDHYVRTPAYDNLEQLMTFLNTLLSTAQDYDVQFGELIRSEETAVIRRTMELTATCGSYEQARALVLGLQDCPYRCLLDALSMMPVRADGSGRDRTAPLTDGAVQVTVSATFYELAD